MGLRVHLWGCAYGPEGHIWGRRDTLMGQRGTYGAEEALMGLCVQLWGCAYGAEGALMGQRSTYGAKRSLMGL